MALPPENTELRKEAEQRLAAHDFSVPQPTLRAVDGPDKERLLHELHVRQLELEIQNENLVQTNAKLELSKTEIQRGLKRYADLYELAPLAFFTLAPDGELIKTNQLGTAHLLEAGSATSGVRFTALVADASLPAFNAFLGELFTASAATKKTCEVHLRVRSDHPAQTVELTAMAQPGQESCNVAMVDITERMRVQAEMEQLNKTLHLRLAQLAEANSELDAFSSSVAHDLQTPLAALDSFLSLLERALLEDSPAQVQHCVQRVRAVMEQMNQLTVGLLELARVSRSELHLQAVNLSELAREVMRDLNESEPLRQVAVHIQPDILVQGDPLLLRQALINLLGNAWKFTQHQAQASIFFGAEAQADGEIFYVVRDNGAGFDMAHANRLFGAFARLHAASEFAGTGIGLATVKRIVTRHGGSISAQAQPGQGATFRFTLRPSPELRTIELAH